MLKSKDKEKNMVYTIMRRIKHTSEVRRGVFLYETKESAEMMKKQTGPNIPKEAVCYVQRY